LTLEVDDRVAERTKALQRSEEELRKHRDHLQELVEDRTTELNKANAQLEINLHDLQISEEKFRSLVMTIPDIIYRVDPEGRFTFINDAIKRLGYEPEELAGKHFSEIILPSDVERVSRSVVLPKYAGKKTGDENAPKLFDERRVGKRKTAGLEIRLVIKGRKALEAGLLLPIGEETVIVEINSSGMRRINPDTKKMELIGTVGVIRDISARKRAQEAFKNRTAELQKTINLMAGREIRMAELKETIRKLREQIESAGMTPVADDPLKEGIMSET
jgi:PAS domain S-box-containing protein